MLATLLKYAPLIQASAITLSMSAVFITYWYTRRANRKRATLDMVLKTFLDEQGSDKYNQFKALILKDQNNDDEFDIEALADPNCENQTDRNIILYQLNNYELISLGIRRSLFDEKFYKLWFHRAVTKDFESTEKMVNAIRAEKPSAFCEFCWLNDRWKGNPHPVTKPWRISKIWWAIAGQDEKLCNAIQNQGN